MRERREREVSEVSKSRSRSEWVVGRRKHEQRQTTINNKQKQKQNTGMHQKKKNGRNAVEGCLQTESECAGEGETKKKKNRQACVRNMNAPKKKGESFFFQVNEQEKGT